MPTRGPSIGGLDGASRIDKFKDIISVRVGTTDEVFGLHSDVCMHAAALKDHRATIGRTASLEPARGRFTIFGSSETKSESLHLRALKLPDIDPVIFGIYARWLYTRSPDTLEDTRLLPLLPGDIAALVEDKRNNETVHFQHSVTDDQKIVVFEDEHEHENVNENGSEAGRINYPVLPTALNDDARSDTTTITEAREPTREQATRNPSDYSTKRWKTLLSCYLLGIKVKDKEFCAVVTEKLMALPMDDSDKEEADLRIDWKLMVNKLYPTLTNDSDLVNFLVDRCKFCIAHESQKSLLALPHAFTALLAIELGRDRQHVIAHAGPAGGRTRHPMVIEDDSEDDDMSQRGFKRQKRHSHSG